ncbi:MAG: hypothetical protein HY963_01000 [Ignavibacteriales bacterium]|nr:hypothetical protein [Ignavibacteriales bacterium]
MKREKDFKYSDKSEPHKERTREILKAHPEAREFIGRNPNSIYFIIVIVALQITIAVLLRCQEWSVQIEVKL